MTRVRLVGPAGWPRRTRMLVASAVAALTLVATGVVLYRVLAPAETVNPVVRPLPPSFEAQVSLYGQLTAAPLVVGERLRIHAEKRRLFAEGPVDWKVVAGPAWAYRRWPGELVGVVGFERTPTRQPLVVSEWSDGAVVAIGAETGQVVWRRTVAKPAGGYTGRRTGASTVYHPPGLLTSGDTVIVTRGTQVEGYDVSSGERRWHLDRGCTGPDFTTAPGVPSDAVYATATCGDQPGLRFHRATTGEPAGGLSAAEAATRGGTGTGITPWACKVGRSDCQFVTVGGASYSVGFWSWANGEYLACEYPTVPCVLRTAPGIPAGDTGRAWLSDRLLVDATTDGRIRGYDTRSGVVEWTVTISGRAVGADERGIYVVTGRYALQVLDPSTGLEVSRVSLRRPPETADWRPGYVYVHNGLVAIERLTGSPDEPDTAYYYPDAPVVIAGARDRRDLTG